MTGSDFGYSRLAGEFIDYHAFAPGVILAARLKPGFAWALTGEETLGVHPQKRFFAGGANSVRGLAQYRLGPKLLVADASPCWRGRKRMAAPVARRPSSTTAVAMPARWRWRSRTRSRCSRSAAR